MVASATLRQSISQNLALTVVVKLTQSLTKVRGVLPVTSSHWARVVPPEVTMFREYRTGKGEEVREARECVVLNQNRENKGKMGPPIWL